MKYWIRIFIIHLQEFYFFKRFFNEMKEVLADECDFYQCYVRNQEADIYAMYIKRKIIY